MIDGSSYIVVSDGTNDFIADADSANAELSALTTVVSSLTDHSEALIVAFNAVIAASMPQQTTGPLRQAVTKLQQIVTAESGSVDNYLVAEGIKVKGLFAALSDALGFPISSSNVVP